MLSAMIAVCAGNALEVLRLGPEMICLSLRLALAVHHRSAALGREPGKWSLAVNSGSQENVETIMDAFASANVRESFLF